MSDALKRRLRTSRFTPEEEAFLSLLVAAGHVRERLDRACAEYGLTAAQYNVLRILKGGPDEGYPRCEICDRIIDRAPDVTRLVDRLEEQGLVERCRSTSDRRLSLTRITPKGVALVAQARPEIERISREFGERIGRADCRELSRICERIFGPDLA